VISGSLSKLKVPASITRLDRMVFWDRSSDSFPVGNTFRARVYPADRFKTIYHRPTRRETLSLHPRQKIGPSLLVKHLASGKTYALAGEDRLDSSDDTIYDTARSVHLVARGEVFREEVQGTGDDLGPLVRVSQGTLYGDLELRTEERVPDTHREQSGSFFLTCPNDLDLRLQDNDYFCSLKGSTAGMSFGYGSATLRRGSRWPGQSPGRRTRKT